MIKKLLKNLFHDTETLVTDAEQSAKDYTDSNSIEAVQISGTISNISADGVGNVTVSYTVPNGYEQIGAFVHPTSGLNRFHVWADSFMSDNSLKVVYWNDRTSSATSNFGGLVFIKKVGGVTKLLTYIASLLNRRVVMAW